MKAKLKIYSSDNRKVIIMILFACVVETGYEAEHGHDQFQHNHHQREYATAQ